MTHLHPNVTTYLHAIDAFNRADLMADGTVFLSDPQHVDEFWA
jgi:hypothetical protein